MCYIDLGTLLKFERKIIKYLVLFEIIFVAFNARFILFCESSQTYHI